jgi:hypothetical protein
LRKSYLLYPAKADLLKFDMRWESFYEANSKYKNIFVRKRNTVTYQSENLIPTKLDQRSPVLLVFGNPASQSVVYQMCFAFENELREHRIWSVFRKTGWLKFFSDEHIWTESWQARNKQRKKEFFDLEYESPFRLGITVALSLPSSASDKVWGGVAGVKRLFGQKAFRIIEAFEKMRLNNIARNFLKNTSHGCVIAFQRDAHEFLRSSDSPQYSLKLAKAIGIIGCVSNGLEAVPLVGLPPTRYANANNYGNLLVSIKEKILLDTI